jgi:hypothetical protein
LAKDEARLRNEPVEQQQFFKRKTMYNNHNQISIVGSTMTGFQMGEVKNPTSPMGHIQGKELANDPIAEEPEENIMFLAGIGSIPNNRREHQPQ